ncbi:hypothetical protein [Pseudomonas sp. TNT3]|uniref:hypothetical protein n=1 Tax=Pseudomonas sp. TNT3 TaxID=2654097 RepID=UPI0013919171|nr:hypothetical protein [Pseudomonas sp. TNT3]KAI2693134.1 hypothetical protein GBC55_007950 [Pseudomonas sp. TNT3]
MSRVNQVKSEKTHVADGDNAITSQDQNVTSTDSDSLASTSVSPVVDSPPITPPAFDADADVNSGNQIVIYPVRSYLDGKEIRQAGGVGYASPKHEALLLIAKGLATDTDPRA